MKNDLPANWLPYGWTEGYEGGIATNTDKLMGGIIDHNPLSKKWFVIPNFFALEIIENCETRNDAFLAFADALKKAGL